jgi:hypothetical protein
MDKKLYRIYIDEVGSGSMKIGKNHTDNYLTLAGFISEDKYYVSNIHPELEALKQKFFPSHPDSPTIFHRYELAHKEFPFNTLVDKDRETEFNKDFLGLLTKWEFYTIGVLLDKQEHCEMYDFWKNNPYHYCLEVIIELYYKFLQEKGATGDVMIESRGGKEDRQLKEAFKAIYTDGTHGLSAEQIQKHLTSKEIKIKSKEANIVGLQLADLLAYPCFRHILKHYELADFTNQTFSEKIVEVLQGKFYCYEEGHCGIRHIPNL